jgi:hypothetical protein
MPLTTKSLRPRQHPSHLEPANAGEKQKKALGMTRDNDTVNQRPGTASGEGSELAYPKRLGVSEGFWVSRSISCSGPMKAVADAVAWAPASVPLALLRKWW